MVWYGMVWYDVMCFPSFFIALPLVPVNVSAYSTSMTSLYVKWDAIKFRPLDGYVLWCKEVESGVMVKNVTVNTTWMHLSGLKELTNHSIEVAGYNAWEVGPKTKPIYLITEQTGK